MKLVWKGIYNKIEQLPLGDLPENAVKYKEPKNILMLNIVAGLYTVPVIILVVVVTLLKRPIGAEIPSMIHIFGVALALLMIVPHELLHAICFPKDAEVGVWFAPKSLMAFVYSIVPVSKNRFIFISLLPSIVFGALPLTIWCMLPYSVSSFNNTLYSFACWSLFFGAGDYMNVINTIFQVPKGGMTQLSGFHSYWYK